VSSTDAVGVMQLMPSTAAWLASYTTRPLDRYDAGENVRGGVTLLHLLLQSANVPDTIASYYQGLASVRANGLYPDTKAYVANVLALMARLS
jgi:soluble lytic murein transglycosylase-like protein